MKTALLVHSHSGANELVKRHAPWWAKSKLDTFGIGRTDTKCIWPADMLEFKVGREGRDNLSSRLVETFRLFLSHPAFDEYTHAMVIESDAIFLRPPPEMHIEAAATLSGGPIVGFKARDFFHTPWWMDRSTAAAFVDEGSVMVRSGDVEHNSPDFFISLAFQYMRRPMGYLTGTYCRNSLEYPPHLEEARTGIQNGAFWYVHGVKTKEQLDYITNGIPR